MPKFRKKPVVIDAFRFGHDKPEDWFEKAENIKVKCSLDPLIVYCVVETLEGEMRANEGDYILKGVEGEIYPCKAEIFIKTYEPFPDYEADEPFTGNIGGGGC